MAIHKFITSQKKQRNGLKEPLKVWIVFLPEKKDGALLFWLANFIAKKFVVSFLTWSADKNGGSVARGKTSSSCSILFPTYLKRRISENICFQIYFSSINFDFLGQMFLVRKRWVHETASSTRINNPSSTKLIYSKWKNAVLNPSKSFLALKKVNLILSTFKRSFSKKWEKTPSLHIIHSLYRRCYDCENCTVISETLM